MDVQIWRPWARFTFLEPSAWESALLAAGFLLSLVLLTLSRRDVARLNRRRVFLFAGCLAAPLIFERLAVLRFSGRALLPAPGVPLLPARPSAPLLGLLPVAVAGVWLGPGPALVVGLVKGGLSAAWSTGSVAEPFRFALLGFALGCVLRQDYRGRMPRLARQPLAALVVLAPIPALVLFLCRLAHVAGAGLSGLDYALALTRSYSVPLLLESAAAGSVLQAVYLLRPQWRPVQATRRWSPYSRTLNRRLLSLFVPLIGFMTVVLVYGVTAMALRLAVSEAVKQMARDANSAAEEIPHFVQTGQGLLAELAEGEGLWQADERALEDQLHRGMQMVVFFDQLFLLDATGDSLACYPPEPAGGPQLTVHEQALLGRVFESGAPEISKVHRSPKGIVHLTFLAPMSTDTGDEQDEDVARVLLGRTRIDSNPLVGRIVDGLQWTEEQGTGFIVDAEGRIVAHPNPERLLSTWDAGEERSPISVRAPGRAYQTRDAQDNTRQLVYYVPAEGYPWGVVIRLPYTVVLDQAGRIAAPLLGLQVLLGGGLVIVISLVTNWVTRPLHQLASAADSIAEGDLYRSVGITGQDEVARVGDAFEKMRVRLKDRMEALALLLQVSRAVSATLELAEGMPFILEGALRAMDARVARVVFLDQEGSPDEVMSRGWTGDALTAIDGALAEVAPSVQGPLIIGNLRRAKSLFAREAVDGRVEALLAVTVRSRDRVSAVMWMGCDAPRHFSDSDVDLFATLASQTSVLVENARLFDSAEGERRRLAAILASTTDAVLVTDRDDRVLLINPAAERAFEVRSDRVEGRPIDEAPLPGVLRDVFHEPLKVGEALARELVLADGRILYANVSAAVSSDGQRLGRVAVMRDITRLKELDELKSEFVSAVSHDLRSPLTFVRGYTTMLSTAGELNEDQQRYVDKILRGVAQISDLVEDLLDLRRIEAGVGLECQPCNLGVIVSEAVDARRMRAEVKDIALRLEMPDHHDQADAVIVSGDAPSLRQAITNLIDNAIKYTPSRGEVVVTLSVVVRGTQRSDDGYALIEVSDTGIGIAPEDQVRLFEKFYRVKRQDVPGVPGTGLGLSLVKSIVERHDGAVEVESELDEGSTFTITFPLVEPEIQPDVEDAD